MASGLAAMALPGRTLSCVRLDKIAIIVDDYDRAIAFFTGALGFDLVEDSPSLTNDGRQKRWVVVRPPGGDTALLLAQADGERQAAAVGNQTAGRVGFFLEVDDFEAAYRRMTAAGVEFFTEPRTEPYGRVAVFADIAGNRWDLLGPVPAELISAKHSITSRKP
jgi:catechol 2,3-dioxygenase-like lactoylglutathione lyase family enzyme